MQQSNNRIRWIDVAKALTILLVVFGHTVSGDIPRKIVYSFHVAAFFFLSGMLCKAEDTGKQIKKDIVRILIPYYIFGIVSIVIFAVLGKFAAGKLNIAADASFGRNLLELLIACPKGNRMKFNMPLWFLPCLFVTKLLYYKLYDLCKGKSSLVLLSGLVVAAAGFIYTRFVGISLPFNLNVAFKMVLFFAAGRSFFLALPKLERLFSTRGKTLFLGIALLVAAFLIAGFSPRVNYSGDTFPNILAFLTTSCLGILGLCFLSMGICQCSAMEYVGKRTLAILLMHKFPVLLFQTVGPAALLLDNTGAYGVLSAIAVSLISIGLCLVAEKIISRWMPFLFGDFSSFSRQKQNTV